MISHRDQVWWGWLNDKQQITVKRFVSREQVQARENHRDTRGIFDPFPASCVEEAMEICLSRYRMQLEEDNKLKEIQQ